MKIKTFFYLALYAVAGMNAIGCLSAQSEEKNTKAMMTVDEDFGNYWYQGKAELTRYSLEQARYGEIHKGDAALIFVTEDFLTDKQVKYEFGDRSHAESILKLNFTRKFYTGIYPYSMMTSVFTPVNIQKRQHSLKVTTSNQEWCGHTFSQLNFRDNKFKGISRSYFQSEGDKDFDLDAAILEDELWARIRIAPKTLPIGEIDIIPGLQYIRLGHRDFKIEKATAQLTPLVDNSLSQDPLQAYTINYKDLSRKLIIKFEKAFPHSIVAWEDTYTSGWGEKKRVLTTRAVKTHAMLLDYWNKNSVADSTYRKQLGLFSN